ncbi:MAG: response regulator transcription factor [Crocinitomicaceae bacterium]|nr:response regulator transcription factor [Flavobacteriales bacterium]NQZ36196.1 response regulator transcription factor [Crocinitomicaceae bacterium]
MKKILIVDDEVFISEQLNKILTELNYLVTDIAFDAKSAITSIKNDPPDLVILDIKMHGENQGFDIAKYIRSEMDIPFIFLTSFANESTVKEASTFKPNGYLLKPFSKRDIFSTLEVVFKAFVRSVTYLTFKIGYDTHNIKIKLEDLLWIKSSDKYIEIQTKERRYIKREGIDSFLNSNDLTGIVRVHRSFAVNLLNIQAVNNSNISINGNNIPISRKYANAFRAVYNSM